MSENNIISMAATPIGRAGTKRLDAIISQDVMANVESGAIHLFPEYSASDAIKSAIIKIADVTTYDGQYALDVCTQRSVITSLRYMVYQGLDPAKNQCYFIPRFNKDKREWSLDLMRSYFGTVVATRRLCPEISDINAQVIHQGDTYRIEIDDHGNMVVRDHSTVLENLDKPIVAAYAKVFGADDAVIAAGVMSWSELQKAWGQSSNRNWQQPGSVQSKFPQEMAKRTVLNRVCKMLVNSSTDKSMMAEAYRSTTANEYRDVTPKPQQPNKVSCGGAVSLADKLAAKASVKQEEPTEPAEPEYHDVEPDQAEFDEPDVDDFIEEEPDETTL